MLNRREFLQAFIPALIIGPALAEELILPNRTIFLPPAAGWVTPIERGRDVAMIVSYLVTHEEVADNWYSFNPDIRLSERLADHIGENRRLGKVAISNRAYQRLRGL